MSVTGDFAELQRIASRIRKLPRGLTKMAKAIGEEGVELVRMGFESTADPYGALWAPLKARSGKTLQDTGRLRNSYHYRVRGTTVTIGGGAKYGQYHQAGTKRMPARKMIPDQGMPRCAARRALRRRHRRALRRRHRRGRRRHGRRTGRGGPRRGERRHRRGADLHRHARAGGVVPRRRRARREREWLRDGDVDGHDHAGGRVCGQLRARARRGRPRVPCL
ncbi:MAG: phage virion morphogenesis protein [Polyangiaceae bacterium]|nr:phage virion morphogenesis protein [Polyangiaceae bacterium]